MEETTSRSEVEVGARRPAVSYARTVGLVVVPEQISARNRKSFKTPSSCRCASD